MRILVTGCYDPNYNRTAIILDGMRRQGVDLIEQPLLKISSRSLTHLKKLDFDVIFLPSFTHKSVVPIRRACHKPIVFDPLISRYLTKVFDYQNVSRFSPVALKTFLSDRSSFRAADIVISDTAAHARYYERSFGLKSENISVVPVGVDCRIFTPLNNDSNSGRSRPLIGFYGSFNPLQGIDTIIKAAAKQPDLDFEIIGDGFVGPKIKKLLAKLSLENINLTGWLPYDELPRRINQYDICLGIFGTTPKTPLVIPNKIFHYAACAKPIITLDTPAIREVFTDKSDILLCQEGEDGLSAALSELTANSKFRAQLGLNARELMLAKYDSIHIASGIVEACKKAILKFGRPAKI